MLRFKGWNSKMKKEIEDDDEEKTEMETGFRLYMNITYVEISSVMSDSPMKLICHGLLVKGAGAKKKSSESK